jgi:hypothetical protein
LELAKVFIEEENLTKLSAFFYFCLKVSPAAASSRATVQNFQTIFGYSIVKHLKNAKGAVTSKSLKRNLRYRSLKQF